MAWHLAILIAHQKEGIDGTKIGLLGTKGIGTYFWVLSRPSPMWCLKQQILIAHKKEGIDRTKVGSLGLEDLVHIFE